MKIYEKTWYNTLCPSLIINTKIGDQESYPLRWLLLFIEHKNSRKKSFVHESLLGCRAHFDFAFFTSFLRSWSQIWGKQCKFPFNLAELKLNSIQLELEVCLGMVMLITMIYVLEYHKLISWYFRISIWTRLRATPNTY